MKSDATLKALIRGTLKSLLVTINGLEGLGDDHVARHIRELLFEFKNRIAHMHGYQTNRQMRTLDAVFKAAGWDDQGIRWTSYAGGPDEPFIVVFTDAKRTKWNIT